MKTISSAAILLCLLLGACRSDGECPPEIRHVINREALSGSLLEAPVSIKMSNVPLREFAAAMQVKTPLATITEGTGDIIISVNAEEKTARDIWMEIAEEHLLLYGKTDSGMRICTDIAYNRIILEITSSEPYPEQNITIEHIEFEEQDIESLLEELQEIISKKVPENRHLKLKYISYPPSATLPSITIVVDNIELRDILRYLARAGNLIFLIDGNTVIFLPAPVICEEEAP